MRIGTMRPEEARVFDSQAGFHPYHLEPGSFEVFWHDGPDARKNVDGFQTVDGLTGTRFHDDETGEVLPAGWYWWACWPGCLPDSDPIGPFATSTGALYDADEWHPEHPDHSDHS